MLNHLEVDDVCHRASTFSSGIRTAVVDLVPCGGRPSFPMLWLPALD